MRQLRRKMDFVKGMYALVSGAYYVIIIILFIFMMIQVAQCLLKYIDAPTYMKTSIPSQMESNFPAISVCSSGSKYRAKVLAENGFASEADYEASWRSNNSFKSPEELYEDLTLRPDDVFSDISMEHFQPNPLTELSSTSIQLSKKDPSLKEQRHKDYGKCYTIHPSRNLRALGINNIHMSFKIPTRIFIHPEKQFMNVNTHVVMIMEPNSLVENQITYEEIQMIDKSKETNPFRNFFDQSKSCSQESFDSCYTRHFKRLIRNKLGCRTPWIKAEGSNICRDSNLIQKALIEGEKIQDNLDQLCKAPCIFLVVKTGASNTMNYTGNGFWAQTFSFDERIVLSVEQYLYNFTKLVGDIGGYVGLLMGVAMLDLFHFLRMLTLNKTKDRFEVRPAPQTVINVIPMKDPFLK